MPFACTFRYAGLIVSLIMAWGAVTTQPRSSTELGAGGTHQAAIDQPTIGESVSGFWPNNQHEGGFEGLVSRFRASGIQRNWCLSR